MFRPKRKFFALRIYRSGGRISRGRGGWRGWRSWVQVLSPPTRLDSDADAELPPHFHGLTPTAKCCRRIRGSTGTPGLAPRDDPIYSVAPTQLRRLGQEYSPRRCPGDHLFENRCAHGGWWFWRGSGCRARQLVPRDAAASRWVDQLEDAVRVLANNPFTFQSKVLTKHSSN